jgi:hypothetical protein
MKFKTLIIVLALLFAASVSFAGDKISIDDIYGTWVNPDYKFGFAEEVIILNSDGTIVGYQYKTDIAPEYTCQSNIADSWYDNEGNLWIKFDGPCVGILNPNFYTYWLNKFRHDSMVWESVWSEVDYPTEMSPIGGNYVIYYRQ